jgi:AcrR family transcriptional regulator
VNDTNTKRTTEPLTRDRAIRAAVALADEDGIAGLSMRKLAKSLRVEAMSLYHHVASKGDLLDGMIDSVFAEIELPSLDLAWKAAMMRRSDSLRGVLLRHRWAVGLMDSRSSPGMATLRQHDAMIGCCRAAGFTVVGAGHALSLIDSYVYGFVLQEVSLPFGPGDDMGQKVDEIVPAEMLAAFPHLAELTTELVLRPGYQYGDEFAFGIELVVDGLLAST